MPATAFGLGTWQVYRWQRKLQLIDEAEIRIRGEPVRRTQDLIDKIELDGVPCSLRGRYRHNEEMLVGPRLHGGVPGYHVIVPFDADDGGSILVNRGWIDKRRERHRDRPASVRNVTSSVYGLLRRHGNRNLFTPANDARQMKYYWVDVDGMAMQTHTMPVLLEQTMPSGYATDNLEAQGIPIPREHVVLLRNNHVQYIFTWYMLAFATALMSLRLFRKTPSTTATGLLRERHHRLN
ncbi:surf-like protein [Savitreella phatthalungensis]